MKARGGRRETTTEVLLEDRRSSRRRGTRRMTRNIATRTVFWQTSARLTTTELWTTRAVAVACSRLSGRGPRGVCGIRRALRCPPARRRSRRSTAGVSSTTTSTRRGTAGGDDGVTIARRRSFPEIFARANATCTIDRPFTLYDRDTQNVFLAVAPFVVDVDDAPRNAFRRYAPTRPGPWAPTGRRAPRSS